ncbi:Dihydroorotase [Cupriavidus necator]|nr:hypothetical protein [Cupriavidus necator]QQB80714.1 hypothetical protein I6H87_23695 [Cupriavidus necator]WKA45007.1 hypothetical protein QWP09_24150 [Cupriavidus necator]
MNQLLVRNVRLAAGNQVDILIADGQFARIGAGLEAPAGCQVEDGNGALA